MAGATLLTLLDDIASLLDDILSMSQVAIKKTAGVLGGIYLCYEWVEKILHSFLHRKSNVRHVQRDAVANPEVDLVQREKSKIRGAIRTDFILSAETIVITLGTLAGASCAVTLGVLLAVGALMTVGVYGLMAAIVKLDDLGLRWIQVQGSSAWHGMLRTAGRRFLWFAPSLMRTLSVAGTIAMFLVGGRIVTHHWHTAHAWSDAIASRLASLPGVGSVLHPISPLRRRRRQSYPLSFGFSVS